MSSLVLSHPLSFDVVKWGLSLESDYEVWRKDFDHSANTVPLITRWLASPYQIEATCRKILMGQALQERILHVAKIASSSFEFIRLVSHAHYLIYEKNKGTVLSDKDLPMLPVFHGDLANFFYAFVFLSGTELVFERNAELGIPSEITAETLRDLQTKIYEQHTRTGQLAMRDQGWFTRHCAGELYALGRLQFEMSDRLNLWIFQHRDSKEIVSFEPDASQNSPTEEWKCIFSPESQMISVHIPATGPLDEAECRVSFARAEDFFWRYFPKWDFDLFVCQSWLMDDQLAECLPPSSNIVRFLRLFHHFQIPGADDRQMFERVFHCSPKAPAELPHDTSLRRALIKHMKNGGRWRLGGGLVTREEAENMTTIL